MTFIPTIIRRLYAGRLNQIDDFRKNPVDVQQKVLSDLLAFASSTDLGRQYGFSSISSAAAFQSRVPLNSYEDYLPLVERMRAGEDNVTWPGSIRWFAKSSGTTSTKSKFIPVSRESLYKCHFQAAKDILTIYCSNYPSTRMFSGKALTLGGSTRINQAGNNSVYGDL